MHHRRKRMKEITRGCNRLYHKKRLELVLFLGGKCCKCGCSYRQRHLEFNHLKPRTWKARDFGRTTRLNKYWEEARQGLLNLACRTCNAQLGKPFQEVVKEFNETAKDESKRN